VLMLAGRTAAEMAATDAYLPSPRIPTPRANLAVIERSKLRNTDLSRKFSWLEAAKRRTFVGQAATIPTADAINTDR